MSSRASNHSSSDDWVEIRNGHWLCVKADAPESSSEKSSSVKVETQRANTQQGLGSIQRSGHEQPSGPPGAPAGRKHGGVATDASPLGTQGDSMGVPYDESSDSADEQADEDVDQGPPPSIGSVHHAAGNCRPCIHFRAGGNCVAGESCRYCHFHHSVRQFKAKNKTRPCKGKRDRYRKFSARVLESIYTDPWHFDVEHLELPLSIRSNPILRRKFDARMQTHLDRAKQGYALPSTEEVEDFLLTSL
mmetsp:Transcript_46261/g.107583  ORF Transcript_46261/g.107583 Transcript_46261/m.107583 type:complete len:247 (-) Transcript_46261:83-823(-)